MQAFVKPSSPVSRRAGGVKERSNGPAMGLETPALTAGQRIKVQPQIPTSVAPCTCRRLAPLAASGQGWVSPETGGVELDTSQWVGSEFSSPLFPITLATGIRLRPTLQ